MKQLVEIFRKIGGLSQENEKELLKVVKRIECNSKTILQAKDTISNKIYIIEKGIARTFYYKDGKDITYWLAAENDLIGSMSSFFMQTPSNKIVETIEDCILWEFEYNTLQNLFETNKELGNIGRLFANYGIAIMEQRFDNLLFYNAKQRYNILLEKRPDIIRKVPLGMIASYLGITQETLSRIRK
jgi:CRP-like cAMP-binding protein